LRSVKLAISVNFAYNYPKACECRLPDGTYMALSRVRECGTMITTHVYNENMGSAGR
jgi:hypothetical protein